MKLLVRLFGFVIMLVDVIVFGAEHLIPLLQHPPQPQVWRGMEVTAHLGILAFGYSLLDHDRALQVWAVVRDKLPSLGKQ